MKEKLSPEAEKQIKESFYAPISPERWVAKNGHRILCGDFRRYEFSDKVFQKWIHKVFDLLFRGKIEELRNKFLSKEEIQEIEKEEKEIW